MLQATCRDSFFIAFLQDLVQRSKRRSMAVHNTLSNVPQQYLSYSPSPLLQSIHTSSSGRCPTTFPYTVHIKENCSLLCLVNVKFSYYIMCLINFTCLFVSEYKRHFVFNFPLRPRYSQYPEF